MSDEVKMVYTFPDDLRAVPGMTTIIQHQEHEFILSFFDVMLPPAIGTDEGREAVLRDLEENGLEAKCTARVVIPAGRMASLIDTMIRNYQGWYDGFGNAEEQDTGRVDGDQSGSNVEDPTG